LSGVNSSVSYFVLPRFAEIDLPEYACDDVALMKVPLNLLSLRNAQAEITSNRGNMTALNEARSFRPKPSPEISIDFIGYRVIDTTFCRIAFDL